jgi:hypothetical protein
MLARQRFNEGLVRVAFLAPKCMVEMRDNGSIWIRSQFNQCFQKCRAICSAAYCDNNGLVLPKLEWPQF